MKSIARLLAIAAAVALPASASADLTYAVSQEAAVSDSGITCRPQDGGKDFSSFSRSAKGIKNTSSTTKRVYCQITPPVWDSELGIQQLKSLMVWATPSETNPNAWPSCQILMVDTTGKVTTAAAPTFDNYYGAPVIMLPAGELLKSPDFKPVSFAYTCELPPTARINGSFARMTIGRIHGGT